MSLDKVSKLLGIISSLAAVVALLWNVHVFQATAKSNEEVLRLTVAQQQGSAAVELHNSYLNLAFQNSAFAFEKQNVADLPPEKQQRYILFAIATVRVAERLHSLTKGNSLWDRSIDEMLANHLEFIVTNFSCSDFSPEFGAYLKKRVNNFACK